MALVDIPRNIKMIKDKGKSNGKGKGKATKNNGYGSDLCRRFQVGKCLANNCKFPHRCGKVLGNNRICGGQHPAMECTVKPMKY